MLSARLWQRSRNMKECSHGLHGLLFVICCFLLLAESRSSQELDAPGVGLGNTETTFVENGVDKSPIRGIGTDGRISDKGLADDDSFKIPDFWDSLAADPACDQAGPEFSEYRAQLMEEYPSVEEDEDMKAVSALNFFNSYDLRRFKIMDRMTNACFLGMAATVYHIARHRALVENNYHSGAIFARSLDRLVGTIHPDKFDTSNTGSDGKLLWPVSDELIGKLQRDIARMSKGLRYDHNCGSELGCVNDTKPMHGNIFHTMGNDTLPLPPGISEETRAVLVENAFKIYVYAVLEYKELGKLAAGMAFCKENQWGFEVLLHQFFLACDCRTDDPEEADFFFVPHYTACHLNVNTFNESGSDALFRQLIPKLQYFRRTQGRDHIFVWGGGFGVDGPFQSWREYIPRSIFLMTETEYWNPYHWQTRPGFSHAKDIVLPGRVSVREIQQHNDTAFPMRERQYIGDFVGWNRPLHRAQGTAESPRQRLLKWASIHEDMHIRQDVPYKEAMIGSITSRFCFVPRGKSAWSSRLFRVLFAGCVPVLLNDDYVLPFTGLLSHRDDWYVRWPMREVNDELVTYLRSFDIPELEVTVNNGEEARCWYIWPPSTIDAAYFDFVSGELDKACPEWRTKNAYLAVMYFLMQKMRTSKSSSRTYFLTDPGTGQTVYLDNKLSVV